MTTVERRWGVRPADRSDDVCDACLRRVASGSESCGRRHSPNPGERHSCREVRSAASGTAHSPGRTAAAVVRWPMAAHRLGRQETARVMRGFERAWVRMLDSATWRRTAQSSPIRGLRRSEVFLAADLKRRSVLSHLHSRRARDRYDDIHTLCLLIGHTKSGGSLLGALVDAHPNVAFADEVDALAYLSAGFEPQQLYYLLDKGARREAMKGKVTARRLDPYSFAVPGQWQGRSTKLRVVGDSKAGIATQRLGADPDLIHDLEQRLGDVKLRFLHVVRNPFDPMSAMVIRGKRTFESAIARYFANCAILEELHARLPGEMLISVRYEDMVADPAAQLESVCDFLGLDTDASYLEACASIVHIRLPERTLVDWDDRRVDHVEKEMARYSFLDGYAFDLGGERT